MSTQLIQEAHKSMAVVADGALPTSNYSLYLIIQDGTVSDEHHQAVNSMHAGDVADSITLCSWTSLMSISCISCDLSSSTCLNTNDA